MRCGNIPGVVGRGPILDDEGWGTGLEWAIQGGVVVAYQNNHPFKEVAVAATSFELLKRVRVYLETHNAETAHCQS